MTADVQTPISWTEANQQYLAAQLVRVLGRVACGENPDAGGLPADAWQEKAGEGMPPALVQLERAFGLSPFERDVVLLCAGTELDAAFAQAVPRPTFRMALAALEEAHWSALSPGGVLRYWRLVHPGPGAALADAPLRLDERVLHFLAGVQHLDAELEGYAERVTPAARLAASHDAVAESIVATWQQATGGVPVVHLLGADEEARPGVAAQVCARLGMPLYRLFADALPAAPDAFDGLRRLWTREAVLSRAALLLDVGGEDEPAVLRRVARFAEGCGSPVFVATAQALTLRERPALAFTLDRPPRREQKAAWQTLLGEAATGLNGHLDGVTAQFCLSGPALEAAALHVRAEVQQGHDAPGALWRACRVQSRTRLSGLARRIEPTATWDDLVLPPVQKALLHDLVTHVRHQVTVYETWGFARKSARGLGIAALFAGPSGTGKTLAAEVVAHALHLDLLHVDLSRVVSKYIGETEKNLAQVFDEAERGGVVLLFDEADALFGKRSDVKDSHDRYANLEVSYLLQRVEAFRGLAILTTNLKKALDDAFQRRLRFVVPFPFPGPDARADLWRSILPEEMPAEGLDVEKLARLNASGGTIRTIALHAAFLAADEKEPLTMRHLLAATRRVYARLDQPLTEGEIRGWA